MNLLEDIGDAASRWRKKLFAPRHPIRTAIVTTAFVLGILVSLWYVGSTIYDAFRNLPPVQRQAVTSPGPIGSSGIRVSAKTELKIGQAVQVEWGDVWWAGKVLRLLPDGRVKVHYVGWDSTYDEIVPRSRLQLFPKKSRQHRTKPQSSASMPNRLDFRGTTLNEVN
jgi:hypothetical protein